MTTQRITPAIGYALLATVLIAVGSLAALMTALSNAVWLWLVAGLAVTCLPALLLIRRGIQGEENQLAAMAARTESLELRLARHAEAVDALADGLDVAIFLCDGEGNIEFANRRATRLFSFDHPEGRSVLAVTLSNELERLAKDAVRLDESQSAEIRLSHPESRVVKARTWPDSTEPGRVFLSVYDITDLRRLERVRQDFVANVSHELRTPLTTIRAMTETMQDSDDPDLRARYFPKIIAEVDRLTHLTSDLLILSRAESHPEPRSVVNLTEIVRSVIAQLRDRARAKGLELTEQMEDDFFVEANGTQMTQVALNLIDNAINYTSSGSVAVRMSQIEGSVLLEVADTGVGIASEHIDRIFERFYRVDKSRSRETGGTGLGLSIVRHIVETHGGKVTVESALHHGSTFRVTLPLCPADDDE